MPKVSDSEKDRIKCLLMSGRSVREIKVTVSASIGTTCSIQKGLGNVPSPANNGRPAALTDRDKKAIVKSIKKGEVENAVEATSMLKAECSVDVSPSTVRRALRDAGLRSFVKPKKPALCQR